MVGCFCGNAFRKKRQRRGARGNSVVHRGLKHQIEEALGNGVGVGRRKSKERIKKDTGNEARVKSETACQNGRNAANAIAGVVYVAGSSLESKVCRYVGVALLPLRKDTRDGDHYHIFVQSCRTLLKQPYVRRAYSELQTLPSISLCKFAHEYHLSCKHNFSQNVEDVEQHQQRT